MVRKLKSPQKRRKEVLNDNEECLCGSGLLFKDCCKGKIKNIKREDLNINVSENFFKEPDEEFIKKMNLMKRDLNISVRKSRFKQCIHPKQKECSGKIGMKAHSIQNTRILKKLSVDNHIIVIDKDVNKFGADFKLVGRNDATTFTGFCNGHDESIFAPIEKLNFYEGTDEQHFLYAYRSFARSYHKKLEEIKGKSYVFGELDASNIFTQGFEKQKDIINKDLEFYKKEFDDILLSQEYDRLYTISIELDYEIKFAVNSFFQLEYDLNNKCINDFLNLESLTKSLMLNIFSEKGKSFILFSCLKEDLPVYGEFLKEINNLEYEELFLISNNIIAYYCENFVISPDFFEKWDNREKRNFLYKYDIGGDFRIPGTLLNLREKCVFNLFKRT